jgi:Conserved TM helix/Mechanosensitive ion channel
MTATVLERAGDQLGAFLPRFGGALLLLIAGLIVAAILGRLVRSALQKVGLDRLVERWGVSEMLGRAGLGRSLAGLVGIAVRISIIAIFGALSLLGLQFLSDSLNEGIIYIPRLLTGVFLVFVGLILGAQLRSWVERSSAQMDLPIAIGPIAQALVVAIFVLCAAVQIGVALAPLTAILAIALGAVALTLALAFGLGSREVARALTAARYARADFRAGETIRLGDLRGTIEQIDSAATTLRAGDERIRIPNHVLIERVVIVEGESPEGRM